MEPRIILQNKCFELFKNICQQNEKCEGKDSTRRQRADILLGRYTDNTIHILSCAHCSSSTMDNIQKTVQQIRQMVPAGIAICGIACYVHPGKPAPLGKEIQKFEHILREVDTPQAVVFQISENPRSPHPTYSTYLYGSDGTLTATGNVTESDDAMLRDLITVRAVCRLPLSFDCQGDWQLDLHSEIERLSESIVSDSTLFHLEPGQILLGTGDSYGVPDNESVEYLTLCAISDEDEGSSQRKQRKPMNCLKFDVYTDLSCDCSLQTQPSCAPIVHYSQETSTRVSMALPIDVIAVFSPQQRVSEVAEGLCSSISNQLLAMEAAICTHSKGDNFYVPVPHHYQPLQLETFYTVLHPQGIPDTTLECHRKQLHERLCLPLDRPLFRRANRFVWPGEAEDRGYLLNVHEGLSGSKVKGGTVFAVQGNYTYHHYMQDRFDDNKWGCAYRSLQTLSSWFRLQGYTDHDIPGHRAIQQALVDVGDKDAKFVGSRTWIGSLEVSFVLDHLFGVTSKILAVNSGSDLASKGRELTSHFITQGTPIMIGGGVLAHTILGVDYNEITGDISFLILDPHYTGSEDLKTIIDKGWCGWKGPEFWDQHAHYNMCMPQRPKVI